MSDTNAGHHATLTEQVMLARLRQSDEMRAFFIEMWQQNPTLAMQGGVRVQALLSPLHASALNPDSSLATDAIQNQGVVGRASARHVGLKPDLRPDELSGLKQRGVSLVELIMFIVIVSVALAGILLVMNVTTKSSADPLIRKQAMAVAESMLEEVQLQTLDPAACTGALGQNAARADAGCIIDYNGYSTTAGIRDFSTNGFVPGLERYNITGVDVTPIATLGGTAISVGSGVMIAVTVADPTGATIDATGYRAGN